MTETEITTYVEVELPFFGTHSWPGAPEHRSYLRPKHQHVWEIKVRISVSHLERDVEFHDLRRKIWDLLHELDMDSSTSCEGFAKQIYERLKEYYPQNRVAVWFGEEGNVRAKYGEVVV